MFSMKRIFGGDSDSNASSFSDRTCRKLFMAIRQQARFEVRQRISENHYEQSCEEHRPNAAAEGRGTACRKFGPMPGVAGPGPRNTRPTELRTRGDSDAAAVS
jgi:hypothetical protein